MCTTFCVYTLSDPSTKGIRYVGKSKCHKRRFKSHLEAARKGKRTRVYFWIRKILKSGKTPILNCIQDKLTDEEALGFEITMVLNLRAEGINLTNMTSGGQGFAGHRLSEEAKELIGDANRGRKLSEYAKALISKVNRGKTMSQESKDKISSHVIPRRLKLQLEVLKKNPKAFMEYYNIK